MYCTINCLPSALTKSVSNVSWIKTPSSSSSTNLYEKQISPPLPVWWRPNSSTVCMVATIKVARHYKSHTQFNFCTMTSVTVFLEMNDLSRVLWLPDNDMCTSMPQINHSKLLGWCYVLMTASQWFSTFFCMYRVVHATIQVFFDWKKVPLTLQKSPFVYLR